MLSQASPANSVELPKEIIPFWTASFPKKVLAPTAFLNDVSHLKDVSANALIVKYWEELDRLPYK
jgi:hypothetical protein